MNDRELLELAAKACGDTNIKPGRPDFTRWIGRNEDIGCDVVTLWNPILDDGDALRLAVRLRIDVGAGTDLFGTEVCMASHVDKFPGWFEEPYGDNPCAATRRAIVSAAAEIGRQMQEGGAA